MSQHTNNDKQSTVSSVENICMENENNFGQDGSPISDVSSNVSTMRRVLNVHISGSLTKLSHEGEYACTWKPVDGKHGQMFGLNLDENNLDAVSADISSLRGATITNARLLETRNEFPYTLGVSVSCLPKNEMCDTGERYTYTALPTSSVNVPYSLFEADSKTQDSQMWRRKYKEYNASNLDTHGVLEVKTCPYVFVSDKHPVIDVLRANRDLIGSDIDTHTKMDGCWFKVSRPVLAQCCHALRSRVLNKLSTHDLNQFSVSIKRTGGLDWLDIGDGSVALSNFNAPHNVSHDDVTSMQAKYMENFLHKEHQYSARLELTYELQH